MALRWGILGLGKIAEVFATELPQVDSGPLVASGSRELAKAKEFTSRHGGSAYGSYDAVLEDPKVDAVYIALPHHLHAEYTIKAAEANKHILCEKPFTLATKEAEAALAVVKKHDVFFAEAFMYRFHPQTVAIRQLLADGVIGEPMITHASFGYRTQREWDNFRRFGSLGGGGLMDVGCYCVSFFQMIAGSVPDDAHYSCHYNDDGADASGVGMLSYPGGLKATFATGIDVNLTNSATIWGSAGRIEVPSPWFCRGPIEVHTPDGHRAIDVDRSKPLHGNQAEWVEKHLDDRQAPALTWEDSLQQMRTLDLLRQSCGFEF